MATSDRGAFLRQGAIVFLGSAIWVASSSGAAAGNEDSGNMSTARQGRSSGAASARTDGPDRSYSRLSPFSFGDVSYQPGFYGCAVANQVTRQPRGVFADYERPVVRKGGEGRYVTMSLSGSETYTDNLNLAPDERAISDYITEISPGLDACASTGRVRGALSYSLQGVIYARNSEFNDIYNNVDADTTIELLPGHLYLGADTSYGQTIVDPSFSYSGSNLYRPGNKTTTWTSNISPYYLQSLGPLGEASLRYRYGKTIYGDSDIPEATVQGAYFNLASPPENIDWSWRVNVFTQRVRRTGGDPRNFFNSVDRDDDLAGNNNDFFDSEGFFDSERDARTTYFDKATLDLGYQLTRSLELLALGGVEDEYKANGENDRWSSPLWNVGFRWTSPRMFLEARVGDRFFGTSYYASTGYRGRVLDASLSYTEEATTQGLNSLNANATGQNTSFPSPTSSLFGRGVFVQKQILASASYDTALTRTTVDAYNQRREYIDTEQPDETITGSSIRLDYQFQPRTALVPGARWERRDTRAGVEYDTYDVGANLVRTLSPTLQGSVGYSHSWRDSDNANSEYDENSVVVQLIKYF